jgi:hypothetical protein
MEALLKAFKVSGISLSVCLYCSHLCCYHPCFARLGSLVVAFQTTPARRTCFSSVRKFSYTPYLHHLSFVSDMAITMRTKTGYTPLEAACSISWASWKSCGNSRHRPLSSSSSTASVPFGKQVSQLFAILTNPYQGENIIAAIQLGSWIPLLVWNSLGKGRTRTSRSRLNTLSSRGTPENTTINTTGCDQPQNKRDDDIPLEQVSHLNELIPSEDSKPEAFNDGNNHCQILSYRRADGTITRKQLQIAMTQSSSSEPQLPLPVAMTQSSSSEPQWPLPVAMTQSSSSEPQWPLPVAMTQSSSSEPQWPLPVAMTQSSSSEPQWPLPVAMTQSSSSEPQWPLPTRPPVCLKSTRLFKADNDPNGQPDKEYEIISTMSNVCYKHDQLSDVGTRLTTVEELSKLELSTLLEERAREEFRNFVQDGPAPRLSSETDTRKCIITLCQLLRRGCKYSQLDYPRLYLALEEATQHMRKILQESFEDTEQLVAEMLLSESADYVCKTALNVLIMCMTIGARFKIQDHLGQAVTGNLEHVQERPNDMVDLYFEVSDGPSIIFGGRLEALPFIWAAGSTRPKITLLEDGLELPPLWFSGQKLKLCELRQ